jgi:hypothetical protein
MCGAVVWVMKFIFALFAILGTVILSHQRQNPQHQLPQYELLANGSIRRYKASELVGTSPLHLLPLPFFL